MKASGSKTFIKKTYPTASPTLPRGDRENTNGFIYVCIYIIHPEPCFYFSWGESVALQTGATNETLMEIKVNCTSLRDFWWLIDLAYRTGWHSESPLKEKGEQFCSLQTYQTVIRGWKKATSRQMSRENCDFVSPGAEGHFVLKEG